MPTNLIQNPIDAIEALNAAIEQESCIPADPFVILGTGSPSTIDYNLPQSTCYRATGLAKLNIDNSKFKATETTPPDIANNFWDVQVNRTLEAIRVDLDTRLTAIPRQNMLRDAFHLSVRSVASAQAGATIANVKAVSREEVPNESIVDKPLIRTYPPVYDKDYLAVRIKQGYLPMPYRRFSGEVAIKYFPKPVQPKPQLSMVLHYKMCSYLGNYGAGQTVKTFSLLPGEKMEIGIRHYLRNESVQKLTQHVLDSFSTSAADDLQNILEDEDTDSGLHSGTSSFNSSSSGNVGGNAGLNLGVFSLGISAGYSSDNSSAGSVTDGTQWQGRHLASAVSSHVSKADSLRQIDVNVESTVTNISEDEETIKRTLENFNKSRVLNFVFRQLLQEYFTITYLDDVTFVYGNGYPEHDKTCRLSDLNNMLTEVLLDSTAVTVVKNKIYKYLCSICDYKGELIGFIDSVTEHLANCIDTHDTTEDITYVKKRNFLAEDFPSEQRQIYRGKVVNGIIVNVEDRIIRTSSLITEALLGKGEALDCYNQKLQDSAAQKAYLENLEQVQRISIIEAIPDSIDQATNYKKVNGNCCDTPQTQIIP